MRGIRPWRRLEAVRRRRRRPAGSPSRWSGCRARAAPCRAATAAAEPRRRAARRVLGVVRVARLAGREVGELGGHRLAEDHRAGGPQPSRPPPHRARGMRPACSDGAVLGRHVGGVDDVLDADRHAVQRPRSAGPARRRSSARSRLRQRVLAVEEGPGLDLAARPRAMRSRQACTSSTSAVHRAVADQRRPRISGRPRAQLTLRHRRPSAAAQPRVELVRQPQRDAREDVDQHHGSGIP